MKTHTIEYYNSEILKFEIAELSAKSNYPILNFSYEKFAILPISKLGLMTDTKILHSMVEIVCQNVIF